mgnify:FL=1
MDYLFYQPDISGGADALLGEEAKHCAKVLRKKAGDEILITDGLGYFYTARLVDAQAGCCRFSVIGKQYFPPPLPQIILAVSPLKHPDRYEWMVEKCTEAGATAFIPTIFSRSQKKQIKADRITKITISAMKQSLRAWLPQLHAPVTFSELTNRFPHSKRLICSASGLPPSHWLNEVQHTPEILVTVGPEGDFTEEELQTAKNEGFLPVSLGPNRLRTETAAFAATILLSAFLHQKLTGSLSGSY